MGGRCRVGLLTRVTLATGVRRLACLFGHPGSCRCRPSRATLAEGARLVRLALASASASLPRAYTPKLLPGAHASATLCTHNLLARSASDPLIEPASRTPLRRCFTTARSTSSRPVLAPRSLSIVPWLLWPVPRLYPRNFHPRRLRPGVLAFTVMVTVCTRCLSVLCITDKTIDE